MNFKMWTRQAMEDLSLLDTRGPMTGLEMCMSCERMATELLFGPKSSVVQQAYRIKGIPFVKLQMEDSSFAAQQPPMAQEVTMYMC